jgi:eukaryotic-like serine/threonine-protein kinase
MSEQKMPGRNVSGLWRGVLPVRAALPVLILIALLLIVPSVSAKVFMYNGTGTYASVQDLINSTSSGDSVFLSGGKYEGNLIIDHAIAFGALDTATPEIITTDSRAGIILAADGITLNGLNVSGNAQTGLLVMSNNNRISGITVQGMNRGIELKNAANNIFSGNTLRDNNIGITTDRSSRSNTFSLNQFNNTINIAGQSMDNSWFSTPQDYSYNGSSFSGSLGNFWQGYTGTDSDGNGVGDTAYVIEDASSSPGSGVIGAGATESADRAPLISLPGAYTLLVKNTTTSGLRNATGLNNPHDLQTGLQLQQGQNPEVSQTPGVQDQFSGNLPSSPASVPGMTTTPPPGAFLMILSQFWWIILLVVVISVIVGVWVERNRRKVPPPVQVEYVQVNPTVNATVVKRPGQPLSASEDWKDQSYCTVHLPPSLENKYPDAKFMGEGGVGRVFRAWDPVENRDVAVKIPVRFDEVTGTQFTKELHIWQGLHHKNIVEIYAANVFPMPYIEMEFIESSLATLKFPLDTDRAVRIISGVAEGLRYAHERGIVHRDIKPENILINENDVPKITDWGLAKALTDTKQTGLISFSLNYAAPEQLAPNIYGEAGQWTDIYQLGVLFYEMVTGRLPFSGAGMGEITQAILHNTPLPPEPAGRNADAIRKIIERCLQKKPQDRYASVADIIDDLKRLDKD